MSTSQCLLFAFPAGKTAKKPMSGGYELTVLMAFWSKLLPIQFSARNIILSLSLGLRPFCPQAVPSSPPTLCLHSFNPHILLPSTTMSFRRIFAVALAAFCSLDVWAATVQKPGLTLPADAAINKVKAQKIFTDSYSAYKFVQRHHSRLYNR